VCRSVILSKRNLPLKSIAHSVVGTARRSVSFSCDAFALFRFPCPRSCPPPDTGTPDNCRGLRRYTRQLSPFVSFRPACPSVCVSGRPWKLNVNVFKPFGFTDGSRKLCAVRSKPFTASLPAPLCYPCPPTALLREGQRTPHVCVCAHVRMRKT
jgi:hypothetical protein